MAYKIVLTVLVLTVVGAVEEFKDFEFQSDPGEMMIAQESRYYQTIVKPPVKIVKPIGVTNSHRPQYNLDSIEDEPLLENPAVTTKRTVTYTPSYKLRSKEGMIKEAVLKALERKDHVGKFAQILPIIRAMSGNQRVALASLVASQVTTPPGRAPLNLVQKNSSKISTSTEATATVRSILNISRVSDNSTLDLAADSTNQTLAQDLPVAEKLRALNRYTDRKGSLFRRGSYSPKPPVRRTTAEPTISPIRRRPLPARKLPTPSEQAKCELFTNSLCLHADDYPMDVIIQTIRRNKAAAGALLADYRDPGDGALDGVTAAQEAKYTADHYLVSNRRGDTANRDFAGAGEAGFMCPSVVKYARPQRARATSGQWKYIVNTGEHTQTLRLEKCLKPKESCTYLTDNFKSKCVQVYNYHRLLTWDQQNGLHMDIFKVPTCCSCHIEGYSVSFPPLGHRVHETSSEHFPGEDLSSEHGNHAFEAVQSTIHRPNIKTQGFTHSKQLESFPSFSENHELLAGIPFSNAKLNDNDEIVINTGKIPQSNPMDSYGNTYFPDSFNQASSIRNVKRPLPGRTPVGSNNFVTVTLPSYLEPPTPSGPSSFNFIKETPNQLKTTGGQFKRGPIRPSRLPIRKKISGGPDLISSGTSSVGSLPNSNADSLEELDNSEEPNIVSVTANVPRRVTIAPKLQAVTTEKIVKSFRPQEQNNEANENFSSSGKRVNYNYHPIIDFFGAEEKDEANESIDREDTVSSYEPTESEWKPINHPPSRNSQSSNVIGRKKH
ncbi:uncharacterized protein LOC113516518 isoform X2 [Galleria mellonella]|uniref:Uncharacterized protein LOC113516518 isoform X2 n=1 Tax=Galleria mellonella TaxID=7137 RepID=A0ABM3MQN7_GALME|nr:uncharacterized protein LOC113516518 isoform X2 [Galleria mellonella]